MTIISLDVFDSKLKVCVHYYESATLSFFSKLLLVRLGVPKISKWEA